MRRRLKLAHSGARGEQDGNLYFGRQWKERGTGKRRQLRGGERPSANHWNTLGHLWAADDCCGGLDLVYNRTLTVMWGAIISRVADPFAWMNLFHLLLVLTVVMALASAAFSLLAAFTLMGGARSSRTLGLIAAAFGMLGTPPGVALGVFTVAMLFPMQRQ